MKFLISTTWLKYVKRSTSNKYNLFYSFRLIYDVKGRFTIHRITNQEAKYKLCRVRKVATGPKNVPFLYTSDGRTIR